LAPGRVIGALGTGDKLSAPENEAYGLPALSGDERRELLAAAATALSGTMPIWVGAGSEATNSLAREFGATINLWDWSAPRVSSMSATGPVCWAGPAKGDLLTTLSALSDAGATWAVFAPDVSISQLHEWRGGH
jgi:hypothetical protein